jgi:hypothetical protein
MFEGAVFCFSVSCLVCEYWSKFDVDVCSIIYKEDSLWLTIYACYLWEMVLNDGPNASFDNMLGWKRTREKAELIITTNDSDGRPPHKELPP